MVVVCGEVRGIRSAAVAVAAQVEREAGETVTQSETGEIPGAGLLQEAVNEDDRGLVGGCTPVDEVEFAVYT